MALHTITLGTTADDVNIAVALASDGDIIEFEDGTHTFDKTIIIQRSDITLRGESASGVNIVFDFDHDNDGTVTHDEIDIDGDGTGVLIREGDGAHGFAVYGFSSTANKFKLTEQTDVVSTVSEGSTVITVEDASQYAVGDIIYISKPNTSEYIEALGGEPPSANGTDYVDDALMHKFREFITKVTAIDGNEITFEDPLPYDLADVAGGETNATPTVQKVKDASQNVTISDLSITYVVGPSTGLVQTDKYDFTNTQEGFSNPGNGQGYAAVYLEGTYNATLDNITVNDAPSHAIDVRNSTRLTADALSVSGSFNKGTAGNGYSVQLYETFNSDLSNLELYDMRHAFLFSSWHAETGNDVHIIDANRDINFHGGPDRENTVTVDQLVLDYQANGSSWPIVGNGSETSHHQTDIYADNTIVFTVAEGSEKNEEIHANDGGASLSGHDGDDILVGGDGDDILAGGLGNDLLDGGNGDDNLDGSANHDTIFGRAGDDFIKGGGGNDVIDGGADVDTLLFGNSDAITVDLNIATVQITGAGNDTISGIEDLIGSDADDDMRGNSQDNQLKGREGDDILHGRAGNDKLIGELGKDVLRGGGGDDRLIAGGNADRLVGDAGRDIMTGNNGNDIFEFNATSESGTVGAARDKITDFVSGEDRIDVLTIDANETVAGDQAFVLIAGGSFTAAGEIRQTVNATTGQTVLLFNTDGDADAEMALVLDNSPGELVVADFIL